MPTIKLVVIGASGVGKTSFRGQYTSGRFSPSYRATIGADFIARTLPHPTNPDESVTLQIWDTAGQERFSSLSSAFFRGADAVILMFDVNEPETLDALPKWWDEFCDKAPVENEDIPGYCCVVVGNKVDLVDLSKGPAVSEAQALRFLHELIPSFEPSESVSESPDTEIDEPLASSQLTVRPDASSSSNCSHLDLLPPSTVRSQSIAIASNACQKHSSRTPSTSPKYGLSKSRSSSRFHGGTMTTTHTSVSIYHTPSSSIFDVYESARATPEPSSSSSNASPPISPTGSRRSRRLTARSDASTSSDSAATITPSLLTRQRQNGQTNTVPLTVPDSPPSAEVSPLLPPLHGPKLFFASAKTGEGVQQVFAYIAERVIRQWVYEEAIDAKRMHVREYSGDASLPGLEDKLRQWIKRGNVYQPGNCCHV